MRYHFNLASVSSTEIIPTIGLNFSKIEHKNFSFTIWDVGGQKKFREIWESYFADIDVLIWVMDCTLNQQIWITDIKVRINQDLKKMQKSLKHS